MAIHVLFIVFLVFQSEMQEIMEIGWKIKKLRDKTLNL